MIRRSRRRYPWLALAFVIVLGPAISIAQLESSSFLCSGGDGTFGAEFRTGISVRIGASREGGPDTLAVRACMAQLSWRKHDLLVTDRAAQLDLDVFGADLGDGIPVAAFQIKKSDRNCCAEYAIYSLETPPRLLHTISGGDFFSASDVDLDDRTEIWTHDAAAIDRFENFTLAELDFPPTVVFRFVQGQLQDVTAEFPSYFDEKIRTINSVIDKTELEDFKNSDGRLAGAATPESIDRLHRLRRAKIQVLEIVCGYLYSGREQEAWRALADMWPAADVDRIRAALLQMRARGIHSQAALTSPGPAPGNKTRAHIFDAGTGPGEAGFGVTPPRAIVLDLPSTYAGQQSGRRSDLILDLIIDAAGKVRSVESASPKSDPDAVAAALRWKFIPAFKHDRPVASRLRIAVSPKQ